MQKDQKSRIAVIPGDGIGPEVITAGLRALDELNSHLDLHLEFTRQFDRGFKYGPAGWFIYCIIHKHTIDLEFSKRDLFQFGKGGMAGAKIINGQPEPLDA